jgi:hypothetical protein
MLIIEQTPAGLDDSTLTPVIAERVICVVVPVCPNPPKGKVLGIVYRVISTRISKKADYKKNMAPTGAAALIQAFGSAININIGSGGAMKVIASIEDPPPRHPQNTRPSG